MTDNECTTCGRAGHIAADCPDMEELRRQQRGSALLGLVIILGLLAAIGAGLWTWGQSRFADGQAAQRVTDQQAVDQIKAQARRDLDAERAKTVAAVDALNKFKTSQEKTDAERLQTIADLSGRLRAGQLRDPFAKPGPCRCGASGAGAQASDPAAAGPGAADGTQATGVLSPEFSGMLLDWFTEADTINAAYASCRADSASLRATLNEWANSK